MRILVIGANGMLSKDLTSELHKNHMVTSMGSNEMDVSCLEQVMDCVKKINPDLIINPAAYTDVDGCESNTEKAHEVNSIGPRNLALACNEYNSDLLQVSTEYVFDGLKGTAYMEDDQANPMSVYGKSKLAGENHVKALMNNYYIVRTQWLFGMNGKNFVRTMLNLAKSKPELTVVNDQFGCPTYTKDLSRAICQLIDTGEYGTYHITNSGIVSWYEFALEIFRQSGVDVNMKPCTTAEFPRPAARPSYAPLDNYKWMQSYEPLRRYQDALAEYLKEEACY